MMRWCPWSVVSFAVSPHAGKGHRASAIRTMALAFHARGPSIDGNRVVTRGSVERRSGEEGTAGEAAEVFRSAGSGCVNRVAIRIAGTNIQINAIKTDAFIVKDARLAEILDRPSSVIADNASEMKLSRGRELAPHESEE
jgi:hypothetical protein